MGPTLPPAPFPPAIPTRAACPLPQPAGAGEPLRPALARPTLPSGVRAGRGDASRAPRWLHRGVLRIVMLVASDPSGFGRRQAPPSPFVARSIRLAVLFLPVCHSPKGLEKAGKAGDRQPMCHLRADGKRGRTGQPRSAMPQAWRAVPSGGAGMLRKNCQMAISRTVAFAWRFRDRIRVLVVWPARTQLNSTRRRRSHATLGKPDFPVAKTVIRRRATRKHLRFARIDLQANRSSRVFQRCCGLRRRIIPTESSLEISGFPLLSAASPVVLTSSGCARGPSRASGIRPLYPHGPVQAVDKCAQAVDNSFRRRHGARFFARGRPDSPAVQRSRCASRRNRSAFSLMKPAASFWS